MAAQETLFKEQAPKTVKVERAPAKKQAVAKAKPKEKTGTEVAVHKPQAAITPKSLLQVCMDAATNPNVDVAKMKELLAMARDEQARAAEAEFSAAMLAAQSEMPTIIKDAFNPHTKSKYARLEHVSLKIDGIARKHGFTLSAGMSDSPVDDHYRVFYDVTHRGGATRRYNLDVGMDTAGAKGGGTKSGAQGTGSSVSYARRYLKIMIFDLVVAGEDTDAAASASSGEVINMDQAQILSELIKQTKTNTDQFCKHFKIKSVPDLPAARFGEAERILNQKLGPK